jgi:chitosanase
MSNAQPQLAPLFFRPRGGRSTTAFLGATLTAWDPATYANTVAIGSSVSYSNLPVLNPAGVQLGRVMLAYTDAGPVILGPIYQAGGDVVLPPAGDGGGTGGTPGTDGTMAGPDVTVQLGRAFERIAAEPAGASARSWLLVSGPMGAGTILGTAASLTWPPGSTPAGAPDPGDIRHPVYTEMAYELCSTAENSTTDWTTAYSYIEDIGDGRGYTGGIVGFCSGTGDMETLIQHYETLRPGNPLGKYLPQLGQIMAAPYSDRPAMSHDLLGNAFLSTWKSEATGQPLFRRAQRDERARVYFEPALANARADKCGPLGLAIHYDISVNHGPGDDSESYGGIVAAARSSSSKPPSAGGSESAYLTKLTDLRQAVLASWGDDQPDGRVAMHRGLIAGGNLTLAGRVTWSCYGEAFEMTRPAPPADAATGAYVLRFTATTSTGPVTDDVTVTVT